MLNVLDHGFVKLVDHMGGDLTVVNAARVSFGKRKDVFDEKDEELLDYLASHEHTAPYRHCYLTFHIKAPLFVFRQWMKHRIASDFNEISGRYVDFSSVDIYVPQEFRMQAKVNKQGSEGQIPEQDREAALKAYMTACNTSLEQYKTMLDLGVCKEQARCVLPVGLYSEVYWTVSLHALCHFLHLRLDSHAQWEIQQYAKAVKELAEPLFPVALPTLFNHSGKG